MKTVATCEAALKNGLASTPYRLSGNTPREALFGNVMFTASCRHFEIIIIVRPTALDWNAAAQTEKLNQESAQQLRGALADCPPKGSVLLLGAPSHQ